MKVTIEGQEPFVATKGFLVQVPYRVPYSMETVGDEPAMRFEVRAAGEMPSYPVSETPTPGQGHGSSSRPIYTGRGKYDDDQQALSRFREGHRRRAAARAAALCKRRPYLGQCHPRPRRAHPARTKLGPFPREFRRVLGGDGRQGGIPDRGRAADQRRCRRHRLRAGGALAPRRWPPAPAWARAWRSRRARPACITIRTGRGGGD